MSAPPQIGSGRRLMLFFGLFFFAVGSLVTAAASINILVPGHAMPLDCAVNNAWPTPDVRTTVHLVAGIASAVIGALFLAAWAICQTLAERGAAPDRGGEAE